MKRTRTFTFEKKPHNIALLLIIVAALLCASLFLTSCSSNDDKGKINDVEIEDQEDTTKADNPFTEMDVPYGYDTKTVQSGMAYATMQIPSGYTETLDSARHLIFTAPDTDPHVHGASFHLLYAFSSYGYSLTNEESGDGSVDSSESADTYADKFEWELPSLSYTVEGARYTLREQALSDATTNGAKFSKDKSAVTCTVADNLDVVTKSGDFVSEGLSQVTYYFKWQKIPCCLTTLVKTDDVKAAKSIMSYIISSTKYKATNLDSRKTYKLKDCALTLPDGMEENENASNMLYFPVDRVSDSAAGIVVGTFAINTKKTDALTEDTMNSTYGATIASNLSLGGGNYSYYASTSKTNTSPTSLAGKTAKHYTTQVTLDGQGGDEDNALAGTFYGDPANYCFDTLVIKNGNTQRVLCVWYQKIQEKTAKNILSIAANSISFE